MEERKFLYLLLLTSLLSCSLAKEPHQPSSRGPKFVSGAWVQMNESASGGGISDNGGNSWLPSLALDSSDNPVVAWRDDSGGNFEIYIKRWNGGEWVEIGARSASGSGISQNKGRSDWPSLELDSSGRPVVAWMDRNSGNYEIYIKRWDGDAWVEIGEGSASGGGISNNRGSSSWPVTSTNRSAGRGGNWNRSGAGGETGSQ